jgi:hypothetical protein
MGQNLGEKKGQNVFTWWLHTSGATWGSTPIRISLGDGTDTPLTLSSNGVGVANGSNFVTELRTAATANRVVTFGDGDGSVYPDALVAAAADVTNSTVTATLITGISFTPEASSTYEFEGIILVSSAATTTGPQIKLTGPAETAFVSGVMRMISSSTTTEILQYITAWGTVFSCGAVPATNTTYPVYVKGIFRTTASVPTSDVQAWVQSEVASSQVTAAARSFLKFRKIG